MKKYFGTDGIRGVVNESPMTVDTILRVARASAIVFKCRSGQRHQVLIGKDTRLSGYMFETALAAGFCSMGVDVWLVGPIPTPGIAYLASSMRADAGVVISASHNPYSDNGIKLFGPDGFKLDDELEAQIEALVENEADLDRSRPVGDEVGKTKRLEDARGRYISYLKSHFPKHLSLDGLKIVLDCAHGATYKIAPTIFEELGATVVSLGIHPNGRNINEKCGALHPELLTDQVRKHGADLGIALDGDGDRVVFCRNDGTILDGDDVLYLLGTSMKERGILKGGVVGTVMSNFGLAKKFKEKHIPFYRAAVGDRHVVETMKAERCNLGGEQSGHIVLLDDATTGDGTLCALRMLAYFVEQGRSQSNPLVSFARVPQFLKNVKVKSRVDLFSKPKISQTIRDAELTLGDQGRVLVRYSGTELKVRVMVEGVSESVSLRCADTIAAAISEELGEK